MKLKKISLICLMLFLTTGIFADSVLYWYLGASMAKPGKDIVGLFNKENQSFKVVLILGGSGQLLSKIEASKRGDIYTPASDFFLGKAEKLGIIKSCRKLLVQIPVFGLSKKNWNKHITFNDLVDRKFKLAVGNPKTMAIGEVFLKIKKKMGKKLADKIEKNETVYGLNVSQNINYVLSGIVDAGLMYNTNAKANNLQYVTIPEKYNIPATSYLVTLKTTVSEANVTEFEKFIFKHPEIFAKYGFKLLKV